MMTVAPRTTTNGELAPRLRSAVTRLNRRLRANALGSVSPAQGSALAMIERLGAPALNELAAAEQVRPPTMTRIVDALESEGLAERTVDDTDRRCQRVTLTAAGRRELATIRRRKTAFLEERLAQLTGAERDAVARALVILERLAEE